MEIELWCGVDSTTDDYLTRCENKALSDWNVKKYKRYPVWKDRLTDKQWIIHVKPYLLGVPEECPDYAIWQYLEWVKNLGGCTDTWDLITGSEH